MCEVLYVLGSGGLLSGAACACEVLYVLGSGGLLSGAAGRRGGLQSRCMGLDPIGLLSGSICACEVLDVYWVPADSYLGPPGVGGGLLSMSM